MNQHVDDDDDLAQDGADDPIELPIEDAFDLHAIAPADVREAVTGYLEACRERGFREVRIIHGRGTGAIRAAVRDELARHPLVVSHASESADGATLVRLGS